MATVHKEDERNTAIGGIIVIAVCLVLWLFITVYIAITPLHWQLAYSFMSNDASGETDYFVTDKWNTIFVGVSWLVVVLLYALITKRIPAKVQKSMFISGKAVLVYATLFAICTQLIFRYPGIYNVYIGYDAGAVARFQWGLILTIYVWVSLLLWYSNFPVKPIYTLLKKMITESAANTPEPLPALQTVHTTQQTIATTHVVQVNHIAKEITMQKKRKQPGKDDTILGRDAETKELVGVNQKERTRGMYVIGKNGTGKTTFLVYMMLQDILAGRGIIFIDPHGDAIKDLLQRLPKERKKDVIIINPLHKTYTIGRNMYECADPTDLELVASACEQVMHIFEKLWGADSKNPSWGPQMADLLRNIAMTFIECQGLTFAEVSLLLTDEDARHNIVSRLSSSELRIFWKQYDKRKNKDDYTASTLNKVRAFLSNPLVQQIVGQARSTVNFRQFMDEGKIVLIQLPGQYEEMTSLLGAMFVAQILNAILSRSDTPEELRRPFSLYVDEYQNFCTPDMARLLAEGRKYQCKPVVCHQYLTQLDILNRGATLNAANIVVFRVSGVDGEELAKEFDCTPPEPEITGQRPILTPKQEVVDHLLKNGHSNPQVNAFVTKYLRELHTISNLDTMRLSPHNTKQYMMIQNLHNSLPSLNTCLFEVMQKKNPDIAIPASFLDACSEFFSKEEFLTSLRQAMQVLAIEPIMVDSGQHEPIYDNPRSYADVQNQIATELANMPQYHAKCKLGQDECEIETLPLEPGRNDEELAQFTQDIMERSIELCYRPRVEIVEEIRKRQEDLQQPSDKGSSTTKNND